MTHKALRNVGQVPIPSSLIQSLFPKFQGIRGDLVAAVKSSGHEGLVARGRHLLTALGQVFPPYADEYYGLWSPESSSHPRNGFTPAIREQLFRKMKPPEIAACPFANLPEKHGGRWRQGLTAAKMQECHWLRPDLVGQFEFVEWTPDNHLRHTKFVALREDKEAREVKRESP